MPFFALVFLQTGGSSSAADRGPCPHTAYTEIHGEGVQPPILWPCASAVTIDLELVGGAGADGSVSLEISTPEQCVKSYKSYSGAIHECQGAPSEGTYCTAIGGFVEVKVWEAGDPSPCPEIPSIGDVFSSLSWEAVQALIEGGGALSLNCKPLIETTDQLEPDAKQRRTARVHACDEAGALGAGGPELDGVTLYYGTGDSTVEVLQQFGRPTPSEVDQLIPSESALPGMTRIDGIGSLAPLIDPFGACELPEVVSNVLEAHPSVDWIDDLTAVVQSERWVESGGELTLRSNLNTTISSLRSDGSFVSSRPSSIVDPESGERTDYFTTWLGEAGHIYRTEASADIGSVLPRQNGAAARELQTSLSHLADLMQWMRRPFGFWRGSAMEYSVIDEVDGVTTVSAELDWAGGGEPEAAILGDTWTFRIKDVGGVPRVLSSERTRANGAVAERRTYGRYRELAMGIWRPMHVVVDDFNADGSHRLTTRIQLSGSVEPLGDPRDLYIPNPASGVWRIRM